MKATRMPRELSLRGIVLGALITLVFTASNIYLGLKVGLTVASSIPAAVISMAVLRALGGASILENNIVQTQASAAGTLSCVFASLPALIMIGYWQHFPFVETALISAAGGMTGVLFTIPLRRAMVTESALPYPEGVAAAEILKAGEKDTSPAALRALTGGGVIAAVITFASAGLRLLADEASVTLSWGGAVFRGSCGFSLAMLGAGYLVGIEGGLAMLLGAVLAWGVFVPFLTAHEADPAHLAPAAHAASVWMHDVRFIGAGMIAVASVWTLARMMGPIVRGIHSSLRSTSAGGVANDGGDLPLRQVGLLAGGISVVLTVMFIAFLAPFGGISAGTVGLALVGMLCCMLIGFLVSATCGYMAGIVGSSSSPISGICIVAVILIASLFVGMRALGLFPASVGDHGGIAFCLYILSALTASAAISNDNLQDLKTGQLVGATPWRQQVALLIGCATGALVIPPVLNILYQTYGFVGYLPHPGMDPTHALAAPQPALMMMIASGIFLHQLDWNMLAVGGGLAVMVIVTDLALRRHGRALPPLAVGIGIYLPAAVTVTLAVGALVSWVCARRGSDARAAQIGTMLASGMIVGESLMGVALSAVAGFAGRDSALSIMPAGVPAAVPDIAGAMVFAGMCVWFARYVLRAR
ncbi:OPT family oligopeptide transporter [Gluconacetobacter entanii]|uniref:Oligopeptide transporter, OPT family n=4 Tax=Gluconacetobacter entanii TaxID=108528 RepID=A0A318PT67_9PROT|nr:oligopeptide transporter, OPT family [Gluconacetobacter entanii]PYD63771.1 oligopeptide transporter, OPT family [Gluconacetobacter entanii]